MFVLFLFQCIQLTSNVFWQLNFFILFHDYFKVSSGQFCQINLNAYSYYSLWLSTEFLNLHCPWYNFFAFYCFYLYNQRICSFVQLSCYIYLSVLSASHYVKSMTYSFFESYHLFEHNCVVWCSCFLHPKTFLFWFCFCKDAKFNII